MNERRTRLATANPVHRQRGAVLIVALVLLVVMTMLGLTGINTTTLEEKMAANTQENFRAFQAAETAVSEMFTDPDSFDLGTEFLLGAGIVRDPNDPNPPPNPTERDGSTAFEGWSNPPLDSGYSATSFRSAHFRLQGTGSAGGSAQVNVFAGAYQIAPRQ